MIFQNNIFYKKVKDYSVSQEVFELHHNLNSTIQENSISPTENLKNKLITAFDAHHSTAENKKNKLRFLYLKVPLYQPIAAVFMVFLFLTSVYFLSDYSSVTNERIVYKYLTDTIYVNTEITKQTEALEKENTATHNTSSYIQKKNNLEKSMPATLCRSIKDDSALKQFMVSL